MNEKFKTQADVETLAEEVACLKTLVTYMLKALGQADAGRIILNIERAIAEVDDEKKQKHSVILLAKLKLFIANN